MSKKVKLTQFEVRSFVTRLKKSEDQVVRGGFATGVGCQITDPSVC